MPRILVLLLWPLTEIALFVLIGGQIGLWATLLWVLGTGVAGIILLKYQATRGASLLRAGPAGLASMQGTGPVKALMTALAAVCLILPGFLTDTIGILLLLPPVQALAQNAVMARVQVMAQKATAQAGFSAGFDTPENTPHRPFGEDVIDGEWVEVPQNAKPNRPSRWTEIE